MRVVHLLLVVVVLGLFEKYRVADYPCYTTRGNVGGKETRVFDHG
jgi:hypothetical protein